MSGLQTMLPLWTVLIILGVVLIAVFTALAFGYRMGQGKNMVNPLPQMLRSVVGEKRKPDTDADAIGDEQLTLEDCRRELQGIKTISTVKEE